MKKYLNPLWFSVLLPLLLFGSCAAFFNPSSPEVQSPEGTGHVTVVIDSVRTLVPEAINQNLNYTLIFTKPGNTVTLIEQEADMYGHLDPVELETGSWILKITAYQKIGAINYQASLQYTSSSFMVNDGTGGTVNVTLNPLPMSAGGNGFFEYHVTGPSGTSGSLKITQGGIAVYTASLGADSSSASPISLASGEYELELLVNNSAGISTGLEKALHIYPGLKTRLDHAFTADDFASEECLAGSLFIDKPESLDLEYGTNLLVTPWSDDLCTIPVPVLFDGNVLTGNTLDMFMEIPSSISAVWIKAKIIGDDSTIIFDEVFFSGTVPLVGIGDISESILVPGYEIEISPGIINGSISSSHTDAAARGTLVSLIVEPDEYYELTPGTLMVKKADDPTEPLFWIIPWQDDPVNEPYVFTFTMPDYDTVVEAEFEPE